MATMRMTTAGCALAAMLSLPASAAAPWRDALEWRHSSAAVRADAQGHTLRIIAEDGATREIAIRPQPLATATASPLFDGLFALAQQEMVEDRVTEIRDGAFDHGRPLPCDCYQTGAKWPYVWTRDLSYAADLALARLDPDRTRRSLRFKLSGARAGGAPDASYVAQDTGSGGSWPVSTDRVVWFLGARHLLDDRAFADEVWRALRDTLAQDRAYAFDARIGLYRGETSFLDWREQTYPDWTANDVVFIAESFALSTNVLHYEALRLAARMAAERGDTAAEAYRAQADALARSIDHGFWNGKRGMYMSYIGSAEHPVPFEAYDLLGISLAALSGAVPDARARASLAHYPATEAGSPVIWPQRAGTPIYHNRAIWPFVSAYALRAARKLQDPERIAHEMRSLIRGAALAGSNMENYEFLTEAVHVDDGPRSGPVVNSPRQLWSVAGYLDMVLQGVFGLQDDGAIAPALPTTLAPMLFGDRDTIELHLPAQRIVLRRPRTLSGNLLVAGRRQRDGDATVIDLVAKTVPSAPLRTRAPQFAPSAPPALVAERGENGWTLRVPGANTLYVDGTARAAAIRDAPASLPLRATAQCVSATATDAQGIESLHSPTVCVGDRASVDGAWPRRWTPARGGRYRATLRYENAHGPINTGVTAAVKRLSLQCGDAAPQILPVTLPHSVGEQSSTAVVFDVDAGAPCVATLLDGFNMSDLRHFARYTGGAGGADGPLNDARIGALEIVPIQSEPVQSESAP